MTNLPPDLEQAAREAADLSYEKINDDPFDWGYGDAFDAGVRWLWSRLVAEAPKFDEAAAISYGDAGYDGTGEIGDDESFQRGARWQHAQMAAQVAVMVKCAREAQDVCFKQLTEIAALKTENEDAKVEIDRLRGAETVRLAEVDRENARLRVDRDQWKQLYTGKSGPLEQEIAALRAEQIAHLALIDGQAETIESLRAELAEAKEMRDFYMERSK